MILNRFIANAVEAVRNNPVVMGLAVGGSWISGDTDRFSDIDLVIVTREKISGSRDRMIEFAGTLGKLISAFTGEHVGESRLLICLYDDPLLHVDIKFLTPEEFCERVEDPVVFWERENCLTEIISSTGSEWPALDYQWIEDRFWTWVHYAVLKLGRGEYFEALDFLSYLRVNVVAPLLQVKNGYLPRGLRRVESGFPPDDILSLAETVPVYDPSSIFYSLENIIKLYRELRVALFPESVVLNPVAEDRVMEYYERIHEESSGTFRRSHS